MNVTTNKLKMYHGTDRQIEDINDDGRWNEFMFFSANKQAAMSHGEFLYSIEIDSEEIIEASNIFYDDNCDVLDSYVEELAEEYKIDSETIKNILDESESALENDLDCEDDLDFQIYTANCAKKMGYKAVEVKDEHGTSYMIDMIDVTLNVTLEKAN